MKRNGRNRVIATVLQSWVAALRDAPDRVLKLKAYVLPYSLLSTSDLLRIYSANNRKRISRLALVRELTRAGFKKVNFGEPIRTRINGARRLWAVRNREKLHRVKESFELTYIYDEERIAYTAKFYPDQEQSLRETFGPEGRKGPIYKRQGLKSVDERKQQFAELG